MSLSNVATIDLVPGRENLIDLTAIPRIELDLSLDEHEWRWEKRDGQEFPRAWLDVKVSGRGNNLADSLPCKLTCSVISRNVGLSSLDAPYDAGTVALKKDGGIWKLAAQIDVLEARLIGKGKACLSLQLAIPHAEAAKVAEFDFDWPVEVALAGADLSKPLVIGAPVSMIPDVAPELVKLSGFRMRLSIEERKASDEIGQEDSVLEEFLWNPGNESRRSLKQRRWRVGTGFQASLDHQDSGGSWQLTCFKARERGNYECAAQLAISLDEGKTETLIWVKEFEIARPELKAFEVKVEELSGVKLLGAVIECVTPPTRKKALVSGQIANLLPAGMGWHLQVVLWGARENNTLQQPSSRAAKKGAAPASAKPRLLAEPVTTFDVAIQDDGKFNQSFGLWRLPADEVVTKGSYATYFATLSFSPMTTGTAHPVPIAQVMIVDPRVFPIVDADDLTDLGTNSKQLDTATSVCSAMGNPPPTIERLSHIASLNPMVSGEDLVVEVHLAGSEEFWEERQVLLFLEEQGKRTASSKAGEREEARQKNRPHVRSFRIPMSRKDVFGKRLVITAECAEDPSLTLSVDYDCIPRLANLHWTERQDGSWFIACDAHFLPSHDGKQHSSQQTVELAFIEERKTQKGEKVELKLPVKIDYDLPLGHEGLPSKHGLLTAKVKNPGVIRETEGRIILCARGSMLNRGEILSSGPEGSSTGLPVLRCEAVVKASPPRVLTHVLPFGKYVSAEFKRKLVQVAADLSALAGKDEPAETVAGYLMQIIELETGGTFATDVYNGSSGALGLIQFIVKGDEVIAAIAGDRWLGENTPTIKRLIGKGATTGKKRIEMFRAELAAMTDLEQLDRVRCFLSPTVRQYRPQGLSQYYLTVFVPAGIKDESSLSRYAKSNSSLTGANGKTITYASIEESFRKRAVSGTASDIHDPRSLTPRIPQRRLSSQV